jgi:hypothetical protein
MDCPICFNLIENSCIGSCTHHFCYKCLIKWIKKGGKNCPLCKIRINNIQLDKEFDSINNPTQKLIKIDCIKKILIDFSNKLAPGITLKNSKGLGVIVVSTKKDQSFYKANILPNSCILSLNGVPCLNHKDSIFIVETTYINGGTLIIEILE